MPQRETLRVRNLRGFIHAADAAGKETKKAVRDTLREAAVPVRDEWRQRLTGGVARSESIAKTAAGLRVVVRRTGIVSVEQRLGKTTGLRSDFGAYQMRRGVAALEQQGPDIERRMDDAIDKIADHFER